MEGQFGAKPVEEFKDYETYGDECDVIISRNEFDPDGVLTLRRVLKRFERLAAVLNLHVGDRLIGTTHEHPFYVKGKGWTPAQELRIGDEIRLMTAGYVCVDGIADSGRIETVYNLEIEDDHTYFVGCDESRLCNILPDDRGHPRLTRACSLAGSQLPRPPCVISHT